jgi:hypothetical protein
VALMLRVSGWLIALVLAFLSNDHPRAPPAPGDPLTWAWMRKSRD